MPRLPSCTPADAIRVLLLQGFYLDHSTGSHRIFRHPAKPGLVVVPFHRRDLKRGTLNNILKQAGLSTDDFIKLR